MSLLTVQDLDVAVASADSLAHVVKRLSFAIERGETFALVGESGSGKSMTALALLRLLPDAGRIVGGQVNLEDQDLNLLTERQMRGVRGGRVGIIFQEPSTSLNPVMRVGDQIVETLAAHTALRGAAARRRAIEWLSRVGIPEPERRIDDYPFQFSGGQKQRIMIAIALAAEPRLLIADEPTTALDVSIQAQILDLLRKLCKERQVGMIIITHDMGVIADITDRVAVLYRGKLVEEGPTAKILGDPDHPYTRSLISAVPRPDIKLRRFPLVTYIEDVRKPTAAVDLSTHWLGQRRDFGQTGEGALVEVRDLGMRFVLRPAFLKRNQRTLDAVKNVNFAIREGEVFGLVGESGSGKSTVARLISNLYQPTSGTVWFNGSDLTAIKDEKARNPFRRQIQMVFQDPYSSLNPRMRVLDIVAEPIRFHRLADSEAQARRIVADPL